MQWSGLFNSERQPSMQEMADYVGSSLWTEFNNYLETAYGVVPKMNFSGSAMQKGWNLKYQKGGKSLCTLYPVKGYFIALVVIGTRQESDAELLLPEFSDYMRVLYANTPFSLGGRWLKISITSERIMDETKKLIGAKVKPKNAD